jgi:threonine/homoserine/homoserine lactone efflux protein
MSGGYGLDMSVVPGFLGAVVLICLAPGPDMVYLVGTAVAAGRGAVTRGALGVTVGVLIYAVAVAAGLGAVVAGHPAVLTGLQIFGCVYLLWLAVTTLGEACHAGPLESPTQEQPWFRRGLVVNLTNPKVLLFFIALLPQFLGSATNTTVQLLMLGALFQLIGFAIDLAVGWSAGRFRDKVLARPQALRLMTYTSAAVFTGLAAFVGVEAVRSLS